MSEHYFPSNGTEGMVFMEMNCQFCTKDTQLRGGKTYCSILTNSMLKDPPVKQWIYNDQHVPFCTSFQKVGSIKKQKIRKSEPTLKLGLFESEMINFRKKINP